MSISSLVFVLLGDSLTLILHVGKNRRNHSLLRLNQASSSKALLLLYESNAKYFKIVCKLKAMPLAAKFVSSKTTCVSLDRLGLRAMCNKIIL